MFQEGIFPDCWKKANIVPLHKKESKNLLKNYRPIRGVFLDISQAFDKVSHQGLIFKLKSYGFKGKFVDLTTNYRE